jgi:hypothetical protein
VNKVELGQVFFESFSFPCQFAFHKLLHTHHLSSGAGTIGQLVADVPTGLSLTPPQETKKSDFKLLANSYSCTCTTELYRCTGRHNFYNEANGYIHKEQRNPSVISSFTALIYMVSDQKYSWISYNGEEITLRWIVLIGTNVSARWPYWNPLLLADFIDFKTT